MDLARVRPGVQIIVLWNSTGVVKSHARDYPDIIENRDRPFGYVGQAEKQIYRNPIYQYLICATPKLSKILLVSFCH